MNPFQFALQIRKELQEVVWPGGAGQVVFGLHKNRVAVFAGAPTEEQFPQVFPCALIVLGDGTPDDDAPGLIEQTFRVITGVMGTGDPLGEFAIRGGPIQNVGKSPNRGVTEVTERVRFALEDLTGDDGAKIQLLGTAIDTPFLVGSLRHVVFDEHSYTALCTSALHYAAPQEIKLVATTFTWAGGNKGSAGHCSSRFDFKQYRIYETTSLSTGVGDGTIKATVTDATAVVSVVQGRYYTVFADYNPRDTTGSVVDSSAVEVGSYLVAP